MHIDHAGVRQLLKHRDPFLFLDSVDIDSDHRIRGTYPLVEAHHDFFKGHFPGEPIMPGVLLIEMMAQLSGILTFKPYLDLGYRSMDAFRCDVYLLKVVNAVFKEPIRPDTTIQIASTVHPASLAYFYNARSTIHVDSVLKAKAELVIYSKIHEIKY
jgi:3-hydroxymyristoyl/3-hydroxydecanoyl-(acyl carrier protein) dehydratase